MTIGTLLPFLNYLYIFTFFKTKFYLVSLLGFERERNIDGKTLLIPHFKS